MFRQYEIDVTIVLQIVDENSFEWTSNFIRINGSFDICQTNDSFE
jgi:hypothetical protein